jgi:hypothetical protein
MMLEFGAPWSRSLKTASTVSTLLLALMALAGLFWGGSPQIWPARALMIALPLAGLLVGCLGIVSGYALSINALQVRRPFSSTAFALDDLQSVSGDPEAFKGALRLFGNGGLFSFTGYFWTRKLGFFRAFATDPARAVVLKFARRTIVITPDDPLHFIVRARTHLSHRDPIGSA